MTTYNHSNSSIQEANTALREALHSSATTDQRLLEEVGTVFLLGSTANNIERLVSRLNRSGRTIYRMK